MEWKEGRTDRKKEFFFFFLRNGRVRQVMHRSTTDDLNRIKSTFLFKKQYSKHVKTVHFITMYKIEGEGGYVGENCEK